MTIASYPATSESGEPKKSDLPILVVEDLEMTRDLLCAFLNRMGYTEIDSTTDGARARDMLLNKKYGLIVSDWHMQPMGGYELLKFVRSDPDLADIPFIMVTAKTDFDKAIAARNAGVDHYLVKPFSVATLKEKVDAALNRRK